MTGSVNIPAEQLRAWMNETNQRLRALEGRTVATVRVHDGDGVETVFPVTRGYKPLVVFVDGTLETEGITYSVSSDGTDRTIVFTPTAPGAVKINVVEVLA